MDLDFTEVSNDHFAEIGVAWFAELHRRLEPTGYVRQKERAYLAHEMLNRVAKVLVNDGAVDALSVGGDKPEGP